MPIRAILFDRDGVLVRVDWRGIHQNLLSKLPFPAEQMDIRWQNWVANDGTKTQEGDPRRTSAFLRRLADAIDEPKVREALQCFRLADFVHAYPDARPALERIRNAGRRIGVLSNNTILLGSRELLSFVGLDDLVDVALTAQSLGVSKPDPLAYRRAAAALDVELDECCFFDDRREWVTAARALGIHAFQVDRQRDEHDFASGIVNSLEALDSILGSNEGSVD